MSKVSGGDLKVGDTISCWWGDDTIVSFRPYVGPLFSSVTRIAEFARNKCGMTILPGDVFSVTGRLGAAA